MTMQRREMLGHIAGAMAGIVFTGCGLAHPAHAQGQPQPRRREVAINGKRVKTIDIHAHCHIPEALALMELSQHNRALFVTEDRTKADG
jgi:aminocarboxymuconate-semialdehyde decarboxylase